MKKQYLISLLGLVAISVPLGNTFIEANSSNSTINQDKLKQTYKDEYFNYSIEQISMGGSHSAAVVNDGSGANGDTLYTWGSNNSGQLGIKNPQSSFYSPQKVYLPPGDIEQISMGANHSAAVVDNQLYTWGSNSSGQLGIKNTQPSFSPQKVYLPSGDIEQISMGANHSAAVVDNQLYTWGSNSSGQLGLGDDITYWVDNNHKEYMNAPQKVELVDGDIKQISMGEYHSAAVINDGQNEHLYTWGNNSNGQLGIGMTSENYNTPQVVTALTPGDIEQISISGSYSSAIVDNELYTWGSNTYGQLGIGNHENRYTPTKVTTFSDGNVEQVSLGYNHSSAVVDGELYTWGRNNYGQLGLAYYGNEYTYLPQKVNMFEGQHINQISMGNEYSAAVVDNQLYTWGYNARGQLGLGDKANSAYNTPQKVETNFPYFTNINDSVNAVDPKNIIISYEFETNLDVVSVTTNLDPNEGETPYISYPEETSKGSEIYKGTQTISSTEIVDGGEYSYSLDLNYKDAMGADQILEDFSSGTFTLAALEQEPEIIAGNIVKDVDNPQHKASVDYTVTEGGTDPDGNVLTLDEVVWMELDADGEGNDKQLATSKDNSEPTALTGALTCDELEANKNYENTVLIAKYNEGKSEWDAKADVDPFQMDSAASSTTITLAEIDTKKTTKRKATVNYEIDLGKNANDEDTKIESIKWMYGEQTLATSKTNSASGYLTAKGLTPGTSYENTTLVVELDEGEVDPKPVQGELETISTAKDTTAEITKQPNEGEITENSASVSYAIDRGRGPNGGLKYTVSKVEWIDLSDDSVIASSSDSYGTLTAEGLEEGTPYNTELKITMNDGNTVDNLSVDPFTTSVTMSNVNDIPTITNEEVTLLSATSASLEYTVDTETSPYEVTNVQWKNDGQVLDSSTEASGILTAEGLTEEATYNTELVLTYGETGTVTSTIDPFTMGQSMTDVNDIPTITNEEVTLLSATSASIDYTVKKGNSPYEVTNVEWINDGQTLASSTKDSDTLIVEGLTEEATYNTELVLTYDKTGTVTSTIDPFTMGQSMTDVNDIPTMTNEEVTLLSATSASLEYTVDTETSPYEVTNVQWKNGGQVLASSTENSGTLIAKGLAEEATYNTELVLTYGETGTVTSTIDPFTMGKSMTNVNDIPTITNEEVTLLSSTSASIDYTVEKGNSPYEVTNVQWKNGRQVLASSTEDSGTLIAEGLEEGATYNTELVLTYEKTATVTSTIDPFTMGQSMTDVNDIPTITNEEVTLLSSTSASIDYTVEKGNSPYEVTNVQWINGGQVLASSTEDSGTLIAEGLTEGTTYDSTQIVVTYGETGTVTSSVNSFTTGISMIDIEPIVPDTKNGIGWKIITLIIIGTVALITLFTGALTWLLKRNKKNN